MRTVPDVEVTLPVCHQGKVRTLYDAGSGRLLMVASDRVSAFDVVMAEAVPDKGVVLSAMTVRWLELLGDVAPSHLLSADPADFPVPEEVARALAGRALLVRRAEMLPIECIVRGRLAGSAWAEYQRAGTVGGNPVPAGLELAAELPEPLFTPTTKASSGHDEPLGPDEAAALVGRSVLEEARELSLEVFRRASIHAAHRGFVLTDTKLELGFVDGRLAICDEVLTPDSSRFWEGSAIVVGRTPPSFDKQSLRDWLEATGWDKRPPPPPLPPEVVAATAERYREAWERLFGGELSTWWQRRESEGR